MTRISNILYYTTGASLTRAGNQAGPVFQGHFCRWKQNGGNNTKYSSYNNANQTTRAAAIAAGSYFYTKLTSGKANSIWLREVRAGINKPAGETNVKIDILAGYEPDLEDATLLESYTWTGSGTSATLTLAANYEMVLDVGQNVFVVMYNAASAASEFAINYSSFIRYEYETDDYEYQYPFTTDTYREVQNRPGIVYDPAKKTSVFAEDMITRSNGIRGIQTGLGVMPTGQNYNMRYAMNARNLQNSLYYMTDATANTGTVTLNAEPPLYTTPDVYYFIGSISGSFSSAAATTCYINTYRRDMTTDRVPIRLVDNNTGSHFDGYFEGDPKNGRFILHLKNNLNNAGFSGNISIMIRRQIEVWQQYGAQFPN